MSADQSLSRNELLALVARTCEVSCPKGSDYLAVAELYVWLECHGFDGVTLLLGHSEGDLIDASLALLAFIDGLTAGDEQNPTVDTDNAGRLCLAVLPLIRQKKLSAIAAWNEDDKQHVAFVSQDRSVPEYKCFSKPRNPVFSGISVFHDALVFNNSVREVLAGNGGLISEYKPSDFQQCYEKSILSNISVSVSNLKRLRSIADKILVETSESSRSGAGE